ncbi:MAG: hypothetical protein HYX92_21665 [Chloroflexi bacterium]|nr:hypothetical protein [Chloroflexota bacterium]
MRTTKWFIVATCFTVLGLVVSAVAGCAPTAQPSPTPKAAAPPPATATTAPPSAPKPAAPAAPTTAKPAGPTPTVKPAGEQPRYGGILTIGIGGDPVSLDLHRESSAFTFGITTGAYNGLVKYDPQAWPEFKVVADLAASWNVSPDGKAYTFPLVKGAKFHDGTPVTAEDVKFSLDRIRDPELGLVRSPRRQSLANVANIDAPDDSTVKITVKNPQASFIPTIGAFYFAVMPKRAVLENKGDMTKTVVGSGPFKFKSYASGVSWELERNPNYFVSGRPYLDGVKGYIIKDSFTRFAALRTRSTLFWAPNPYMTVSQVKVIEETLSDKITVKWGFMPAWYGAIFNTSRPPWSDVRLRRAVSMAFDRKKMLAMGLEGGGVVGMAAQAPGEWALPEDEMMKAPGYARPDLEGAKKLLAEAGFPSGFRAEALVRAVSMQQALALVLREAVAAIGIAVDLNQAEIAVYEDQQYRKAFSMIAGSSGSGGTDPDIILGDYYVADSPRNWTGYSNPYFDELYAKQSRTLDTGERRKIVWEMQRILLKDVPIAIAYWANVPYAWWKEVRGYTPPSIGHYFAYTYQEVWLAR